MSWDSLNLSDCFILDLGNDIYVWCGPNSNPWERMKANDMGRSIRDDERAGKAEVHLIDAGEVRCPEKLCPYLGDDIPDELPEEAPEAPPKHQDKNHPVKDVCSKSPMRTERSDIHWYQMNHHTVCRCSRTMLCLYLDLPLGLPDTFGKVKIRHPMNAKRNRFYKLFYLYSSNKNTVVSQ